MRPTPGSICLELPEFLGIRFVSHEPGELKDGDAFRREQHARVPRHYRRARRGHRSRGTCRARRHRRRDGRARATRGDPFEGVDASKWREPSRRGGHGRTDAASGQMATDLGPRRQARP